MSTLGWFQWMYCNGQLTSWHELLRFLENQFAPSQYYDPQGSLFKLTQQSSVADHQTKFATFSNQVYCLSAQALLSYFFSGLKPGIQRELQPLQLTTLSQAIGLARLLEEKLLDSSSSASLGYQNTMFHLALPTNPHYFPTNPHYFHYLFLHIQLTSLTPCQSRNSLPLKCNFAAKEGFFSIVLRSFTRITNASQSS